MFGKKGIKIKKSFKKDELLELANGTINYISIIPPAYFIYVDSVNNRIRGEGEYIRIIESFDLDIRINPK